MFGVSRSSPGSSQSGSVQNAKRPKSPMAPTMARNRNGRLMFYRRSRVPVSGYAFEAGKQKAQKKRRASFPQINRVHRPTGGNLDSFDGEYTARSRSLTQERFGHLKLR